jgi:uncharacterized membrane protein YczE
MDDQNISLHPKSIFHQHSGFGLVFSMIGLLNMLTYRVEFHDHQMLGMSVWDFLAVLLSRPSDLTVAKVKG